jgi:DNA-binding NarL/FixJ family response regulator
VSSPTPGAGSLRDALQSSGWEQTYAELAAAEREGGLSPADLERFALVAYLTGRDIHSTDVLSRAFQGYVASGDVQRAARAAFWLAFQLIHAGERAPASGWTMRGRRLLDENQVDCVERGYLLVPLGVLRVREGDLQGALAAFTEAVEIAVRFGDVDLVNLARHGCGRALIGLGETARGGALLDELMVAVTAGELSPIVAGTVYCSVISACFDRFDVRRAHEWTDALHHWCGAQPSLVPFRGQCLVYRAEILLLDGAWHEALEQAEQACERLSHPVRHPSLGAAFYQLADLRRLLGDLEAAEEAYRLASDAGRSPYPGLALLRLTQGRREAAQAAICRAVDETRDRRWRCPMLAASVEILLACGEVDAARGAARELSSIAADIDTPFVHAASASATGAVDLASGDARRALDSLRRARTLWRELGASYEAARVGVAIADACRALGDTDTAQLELDGAARAFRQLGAVSDLAAVEARARPPAPAVTTPGNLTDREVQVLKLLASGKTNRAIAKELAISEKTVARHVSNIFVKLDLSSRTAAAAFAFQHRLIVPTPRLRGVGQGEGS